MVTIKLRISEKGINVLFELLKHDFRHDFSNKTERVVRPLHSRKADVTQLRGGGMGDSFPELTMGRNYNFPLLTESFLYFFREVLNDLKENKRPVSLDQMNHKIQEDVTNRLNKFINLVNERSSDTNVINTTDKSLNDEPDSGISMQTSPLVTSGVFESPSGPDDVPLQKGGNLTKMTELVRIVSHDQRPAFPIEHLLPYLASTPTALLTSTETLYRIMDHWVSNGGHPDWLPSSSQEFVDAVVNWSEEAREFTMRQQQNPPRASPPTALTPIGPPRASPPTVIDLTSEAPPPTVFDFTSEGPHDAAGIDPVGVGAREPEPVGVYSQGALPFSLSSLDEFEPFTSDEFANWLPTLVSEAAMSESEGAREVAREVAESVQEVIIEEIRRSSRQRHGPISYAEKEVRNITPTKLNKWRNSHEEYKAYLETYWPTIDTDGDLARWINLLEGQAELQEQDGMYAATKSYPLFISEILQPKYNLPGGPVIFPDHVKITLDPQTWNAFQSICNKITLTWEGLINAGDISCSPPTSPVSSPMSIDNMLCLSNNIVKKAFAKARKQLGSQGDTTLWNTYIKVLNKMNPHFDPKSVHFTSGLRERGRPVNSATPETFFQISNIESELVNNFAPFKDNHPFFDPAISISPGFQGLANPFSHIDPQPIHSTMRPWPPKNYELSIGVLSDRHLRLRRPQSLLIARCR